MTSTSVEANKILLKQATAPIGLPTEGNTGTKCTNSAANRTSTYNPSKGARIEISISRVNGRPASLRLNRPLRSDGTSCPTSRRTKDCSGPSLDGGCGADGGAKEWATRFQSRLASPTNICGSSTQDGGGSNKTRAGFATTGHG